MKPDQNQRKLNLSSCSYRYKKHRKIIFNNGAQLLPLTFFVENKENYFNFSWNTLYSYNEIIGQIEPEFYKHLIKGQIIAHDSLPKTKLFFYKSNQWGHKIGEAIPEQYIETVIKLRDNFYYHLELENIEHPQIIMETSARIYTINDLIQFAQKDVQVTAYEMFGQGLKKTKDLFFKTNFSIKQIQSYFTEQGKQFQIKLYRFDPKDQQTFFQILSQSDLQINLKLSSHLHIWVDKIHQTKKSKKSKKSSSKHKSRQASKQQNQISLKSQSNSESFQDLSAQQSFQALTEQNSGNKSFFSSELEKNSVQSQSFSILSKKSQLSSLQDVIDQVQLTLSILSGKKQDQDKRYVETIKYADYGQLTLKEFIVLKQMKQQLKSTQIQFPKQFCGIIFEKKKYFRETQTIRQIVDFYFQQALAKDLKVIKVQVFICPNVYLTKAIQLLQKKPTFSKILKKQGSFSQGIQKNIFNVSQQTSKQKLFDLIEKANSLQKHKSESFPTRVCFIVQDSSFLCWSFSDTKNLVIHDVIMFPYFINAFKYARKQYHYDIAESFPPCSVVFEVETNKSRSIDKDRAILLPYTNYNVIEITQIYSFQQVSQPAYTLVRLNQISTPVHREIIIWVDDNPSNNTTQLNLIGSHLPIYDLNIFRHTSSFQIWIRCFLKILKYFTPDFKIKLIQDMKREEFNKKNGNYYLNKQAGINLLKHLRDLRIKEQINNQIQTLTFTSIQKQLKQKLEQEQLTNQKFTIQISALLQFLTIPKKH